MPSITRLSEPLSLLKRRLSGALRKQWIEASFVHPISGRNEGLSTSLYYFVDFCLTFGVGRRVACP